MITKQGKLWVVNLGGREEVCATKAVAEKLLDQYTAAHNKKDPLAELAAKAPVYESFEAAVEDHGEDEGDLEEEEEWS